MKHSYTGTYGRVLVSPLKQEDIEELRLLRNREREWFMNADIIQESQQSAWYKSHQQKPDDYMFAVTLLDDSQLGFIGSVALYDVNESQKNAEFGRVLIDKTKVGHLKGLGLDATICCCLIGFEQLDLKEINLLVLSDNQRAIKTYERAGFFEVDRFTEDDGSIHILMRILKESLVTI